ncbi:hypothetical protein CL656_00140 [bacterium]|nr:hypothetical protein [bacterium]|tara:strand:- start:1443 stop:2132 length:690 start_codon:yes stop_codon:yes gene_type:complete
MISFITLTNTGYIDYTLNCLKSLEKINNNVLPNCYCIGKDGYNILLSKGYNTFLIDQEENSNFQKFRTGNWSNITVNKFKIIYDNLLNNEYVLFTDGDIVYENNEFINYLLKNIGNNDMLIQNDTMNDKNNSNLCSGFMFIKSNEKTINLFNPKNTDNKKNKQGWGDQIYINEIKNKLKFKTLPLHLFPNGQYYYNNYNKIKPYIIHFNWIVGNEKKNKMISFSKWYLN